MSALRIYDPAECDAQGVPLDWERCRTCEGEGFTVHEVEVIGPDGPELDRDREQCTTCDGHGSLKAAALAWAWCEGPLTNDDDAPRCEGCGHPMSDGTWEDARGSSPIGPEQYAAEYIAEAAEALWAGGEPSVSAFDAAHWSPCDEGCRHGGPGRWGGPPQLWAYADLGADAEGEVAYSVLDDRRDEGFAVEASWRQVDVRTLGWAHDLRPERLAVLCTRCWAVRS